MLCIFGINIIQQVSAFELLMINSDMKYNTKEGDILGFLTTTTDYSGTTNITDTIVNQNETSTDYWKFQTIQYIPNFIINGSFYTIIGINASTQPYNESLGLNPNFSNTTDWVLSGDSPKIFYTNQSLGSMFELSRIIIPHDLNAKTYFQNASNFIYSLMMFMGNGHSPTDQFKANLENNYTESNVVSTHYESDFEGNINWNYEIYGNIKNSSIKTSKGTMNIYLGFKFTPKRTTELISMRLQLNRTIWDNGIFKSTDIENSSVYNELIYDSSPFSSWQNFWILHGTAMTTTIIIVSVGLIGFIGLSVFYKNKCKLNPEYSNVCKIYKPSLKSKNSGLP